MRDQVRPLISQYSANGSWFIDARERLIRARNAHYLSPRGVLDIDGAGAFAARVGVCQLVWLSPRCAKDQRGEVIRER
jgi:hypothetical protein